MLTVATDDRRKNLKRKALMDETARRLAEAGIDLAWAGDVRPYFVAFARGAGRGADARLRPTTTCSPGLYRRGALAFALPSHYEGLGLTCLEAMACGTPVVASDRAALPETCRDAALLVDPDDAEALSGAVLRAATEAALRDELRARGLRRAAGFTWDRTAAGVDALLVSLAGPG